MAQQDWQAVVLGRLSLSMCLYPKHKSYLKEDRPQGFSQAQHYKKCEKYTHICIINILYTVKKVSHFPIPGGE